MCKAIRRKCIKKIILPVFVMSLALVTGCGGGSGDDSNNNGGQQPGETLSLDMGLPNSLTGGAQTASQATAVSANIQACLDLGWQHRDVPVKVGQQIEVRNLVWKQPISGQWSKGAMIVLHGGGGGKYSNWCQGTTNSSQFVNMALSRGYAVFAMDASDQATDRLNRSCKNKAWDAAVKNQANIDLPFFEQVLTDIIPSLRPIGSNQSTFVTGISSGGFMTIRASTHFDHLVTAFASMSTGDPYGLAFDCDQIALDNETGSSIATRNSCVSPSGMYPKENQWETSRSELKPSFLMLHHEDDALVDISCHHKAVDQLRNHGYQGTNYVIPRRGFFTRNLLAHFWQPEYSTKILDFFDSQNDSGIYRITSLVNGNFDQVGSSVLLVMKDDQLNYFNAFGHYSINETMPIASSSKLVVASVLMRLVDEGRLSLDDNMAKHLGWMGQKGQITVRQLLAFTSGLRASVPCMDNSELTLAQCVNSIAFSLPLHSPGQGFFYGGASYMVAGRVAEVVSGVPFADLVANKITAPLGMVNTFYPDTQNPRVGGGLVSSTGDYARLLLMHLHRGDFFGNRILSESSWAEMLSDQTNGAPILFSPYFPWPELAERRYGLGQWREVVIGPVALEMGSQGGYGFSPWIDYRRNMIGVFAANITESQKPLHQIQDFYLKLRQLIRQMF